MKKLNFPSKPSLIKDFTSGDSIDETSAIKKSIQSKATGKPFIAGANLNILPTGMLQGDEAFSLSHKKTLKKPNELKAKPAAQKIS